MAMSDSEMGKKELERSGLGYFLDAYKLATGHCLAELAATESPDFVCARPDGDRVGVELRRVMRDPETAQFERILHRIYEAESQETLDRVFVALDEKDRKRSRDYGYWADKTILVLQLLDCSIRSLRPLLSDDMKGDFAGYGFVEIWLADYTAVEAYGDVELFGLVPGRWWGYHQRQRPYRKPYG